MKQIFFIQTSIECESVDPDDLELGDEVWYTIDKHKEKDLHGPFSVQENDQLGVLVNKQGVKIPLYKFVNTCTFWKEVKK